MELIGPGASKFRGVQGNTKKEKDAETRSRKGEGGRKRWRIEEKGHPVRPSAPKIAKKRGCNEQRCGSVKGGALGREGTRKQRKKKESQPGEGKKSGNASEPIDKRVGYVAPIEVPSHLRLN